MSTPWTSFGPNADYIEDTDVMLFTRAGAGKNALAGKFVHKDATDTVAGTSKFAQLLVNCANPVWGGEAFSALAIGAGIAAAFENMTSAVPTLVLWNTGVAGDNQLVLFATDAGGATRGSITFNRAAGSVAYNTTSDRRAKDVLGPVKNSGDVIDALKPIMGRMKGAEQARPMFIADEVAAAGASYAVTGDAHAVDQHGEPVFQQLDVSMLVPLLVAELQALRARIAALEAG